MFLRVIFSVTQENTTECRPPHWNTNSSRDGLDIWTCDFAEAGPHPAVIVSHPDRVARAPLVNVQAKLRGVSLGKTVSDLLRKGLNASTPAQAKDGLVVFPLPPDSPKVTTDDVRRIEAEGV